MSLLDAAYLLAEGRRLLNRPAAAQDLDVLDADIYVWLTMAQLKAQEELANHVPESQYTTELLTSAGGGTSYTFTAEPLGGFIELRAGRTGRPLIPGPDWDAAADFVIGKGIIQFPGGVARSYAGGLYARYVPTPGVIDGSHEPTLSPTMARRALPPYAAYLYASQPGVAADPSGYLKMYQEAMWGSGAPGDVGIVGTIKQSYFLMGSAAIPGEGGSSWWRYISTGDDYVPLRHS